MSVTTEEQKTTHAAKGRQQPGLTWTLPGGRGEVRVPFEAMFTAGRYDHATVERLHTALLELDREPEGEEAAERGEGAFSGTELRRAG